MARSCWPVRRHAPAIWVGNSNGTSGRVGVQSSNLSKLLGWNWNLEKSIATGTHNSSGGWRHLVKRESQRGLGAIAELLLLEIPQYRPSLIRNTITVTPFRGVGFGAVWEAPP